MVTIATLGEVLVTITFQDKPIMVMHTKYDTSAKPNVVSLRLFLLAPIIIKNMAATKNIKKELFNLSSLYAATFFVTFLDRLFSCLPGFCHGLSSRFIWKFHKLGCGPSSKRIVE